MLQSKFLTSEREQRPVLIAGGLQRLHVRAMSSEICIPGKHQSSNQV